MIQEAKATPHTRSSGKAARKSSIHTSLQLHCADSLDKCTLQCRAFAARFPLQKALVWSTLRLCVQPKATKGHQST